MNETLDSFHETKDVDVPRSIPVDAVAEILRELGERLVLPRFRSLQKDEICEKAPGDLVTIVDREVEARLGRDLPLLMPGSRVVGEEGVAADPAVLDHIGSGLVWLVDPLDGTSNFVDDCDAFASMIGLLRDGEAVGAWIFAPVSGRLAVAERGGGAEVNGERLAFVPWGGDGSRADMASMRYLPPSLKQQWQEAGVHERADPGCGSAGIEYLELIAGSWRSLFYWRTLPWDHVPGCLLVREAGGHVARLDGSPYSPVDGRSGLLAAPDESEWNDMRTSLPGGVLLLLITLLVAACARSGEDDGELSRFAPDTSIAGRVVENSTACTVDATCYLRIRFADTVIAALYGTGDVAEPPCTIERAVSDRAFEVGRGARVVVTLSACGSEGYYLHEISETSEVSGGTS